MRKFVKTAAVLALAFALLSTSAFAALTGGSVAKNNDGTYTATINGAAANEQITILGVEADVDVNAPVVPELTDSNILYINQTAADGTADTADTFANFSLKGESNGRTIHFFAGSATSDEAKYLGAVTEAIPYAITIQGGTVEVNKTLTITATINPEGYTGDVDWSAPGAEISGDALGATFSAATEGTYTVTATLDNGASATAEVVVTAKDVTVAAPTVTLVEAEADGEIAQNQNGVGVALQFANLPAGFTHMIWGFGDGTDDTENRRYSTAIELDESMQGSFTFKAAFGNGTKNGSIEPYAVVESDVSALFWDGTDTYFTHPDLDKNNKLN